MKTLYVIRHGNAPFISGSKDFERSLDEIGIRQAFELNNVIKHENISMVLVSTAKRTLMTYEHAFTDIDLHLESDPNIYYKDESYLINKIIETKSEIENLAIVGHNPTLTNLVNYLVGYSEQISSLSKGGCIKIDFEVENWNEISNGTGSVIYYIQPSN